MYEGAFAVSGAGLEDLGKGERSMVGKNIRKKEYNKSTRRADFPHGASVCIKVKNSTKTKKESELQRLMSTTAKRSRARPSSFLFVIFSLNTTVSSVKQPSMFSALAAG